jgi:hypothetical protein
MKWGPILKKQIRNVQNAINYLKFNKWCPDEDWTEKTEKTSTPRKPSEASFPSSLGHQLTAGILKPNEGQI